MSDRHIRLGVFAPPHHSNRENVALCMKRDMELVEWLDDLGYSEFWLGEHHSGGLQIYGSPELFIAAAAERTTRIRLGAGVISLPYHNPLLVADRIVQLDYQTRGRAMFGFGPGALSSDAHMLDVPISTSRARMIEGIDVIVRLLDGEIVTEKTDWYSLRDARVHLEPFTLPRPRLAVASFRTPTGAITAGRYDMAMLCANAAAVPDAWRHANDAAAKQGRTFERSEIRVVASFHLAESRAEALKQMEFGAGDWLDYLNVLRPPTGKDGERAGDPVEQVLAARNGIVGTPDDAVAALEKLWEQTGGFGCLLLSGTNWMNFEATKRSYELFMRYVLPRFNGQNCRRAASLEWMRDNAVAFGEIRDKAAEQAMRVPQPSGAG
ncbi:MAG TPA: LLM class flavin-dependent oxidoreductase [Hyphomicrobiales bacterium]|nr:LLM class flavin-dependent oxidoreductase [Hyphomicrobiales bacterium]